jgi:hypothetical protein
MYAHIFQTMMTVPADDDMMSSDDNDVNDPIVVTITMIGRYMSVGFITEKNGGWRVNAMISVRNY